MKNHDVYAFGVISASTLYLLKDPFPARSGYAEFVRNYKNIGGEAANTSIALARLGLKVKLDGNWLNPDDDADFLQDVFSTEPCGHLTHIIPEMQRAKRNARC